MCFVMALLPANIPTHFTTMQHTVLYQSIDGNQAMIVTYDYSSNAILVEAMKNFKSGTICTAFTSIFKTLENRGINPTFNVLDN